VLQVLRAKIFRVANGGDPFGGAIGEVLQVITICKIKSSGLSSDSLDVTREI
jgi:hypothetical protein